MSNTTFFQDMKGIINSLCPELNKNYILVDILFYNYHWDRDCSEFPCVEIKCNVDDKPERIKSFAEPTKFLNRDIVRKAQNFLEEDSDGEVVLLLKEVEETLHQVEDNDYFCQKAASEGLDASGLFSEYQPLDLGFTNDGTEENKKKYINVVWDKLMGKALNSKIDPQSLFSAISGALIQKLILKDKSENTIVLLSEVAKNDKNIFQILGLIADKKTIDEEHLLIRSKFVDDEDSFVQRVFCVLFQKWSDIFKHSLFYSDSEYIMDTDAVIRLAVRDLTEGWELPSYKIIEAISRTRYENEECHGTVAFFTDIEKAKYIPFERPIHFGVENIRYIRKLLEMSAGSFNDSFVLCVNAQSSLHSNVVGLIEKEFCNNEYTVEFRGFLKWTLMKSGSEIFSFDSGQYSFHKNRLDKYNKQLKASLECTDDQIKNIHFIVETIWEQHHGTMLVLFKDSLKAEEETRRLVKMGRGIGLKTNHEWNDFDRKQLILSLTSIDGALFMDINGTICGFGIIVDGEAVVKGTAERGARYNSAKNYIANCAKKEIVNVALVVSEDRTVDLLSENDMRNSL